MDPTFTNSSSASTHRADLPTGGYIPRGDLINPSRGLKPVVQRGSRIELQISMNRST